MGYKIKINILDDIILDRYKGLKAESHTRYKAAFKNNNKSKYGWRSSKAVSINLEPHSQTANREFCLLYYVCLET